MALWDGDFSSLSSEQGAYTLSLNGNTLNENSTSITIAGTYGVLLDSASALNASTVIIRCSDLNLASDSSQVLFTSRNTGNTADTWKNVTGVYLKANNASTHGIWLGANWGTTAATEAALPTAGVTSLAYQSGSSGGTALYAKDGTATTYTKVYEATGLGTSSGTFKGCAIGGPRDVAITDISAATGLTITGVAVFNSRLSADDIAAYVFPSDAATHFSGTEVKASQINTQFGSETSVSVLLDAGATLVLDATLTATSVTLYSPGSITLKSSDGTTQASSTELAKLNFDNVRGAILRAWLDTTKALGFSFNSSQGSDTTGALYEGTWQSNESSADGTADFAGDSLSTIAWHAKNVWNQNDSTNSFMKGYLDDAGSDNKTTISVSNVPFETYDVVIYCATDTADAKFTFKTVNGTSYYFSTTTDEGTSSWGHTSASRYAPVEGVNTLIVRGLSGDLSISSYNVNGVGNNTERGCIAAIQIKTHEEESFPTITLGGDTTGEVKWSDTEKWSVTDAPTLGNAVLQMKSDATLVFDTAVTMTAVTAENAAGKTLTLTNSDGATASLGAFNAGGAKKVVVTSADIEIGAAYHGLFEYDYNVASMTSPGDSSATNVYARGAGSSDAPAAFSHSGGAVTLTGTTPFYIADEQCSATKTQVTFDGATVDYGSNRFSVGKADYILNDATVTAKRFILSDGGAGRTATISLNGTSSVTVTGEYNGDSNQSSALFGHWNGPSTFTLNDSATFSAPNAQALVGLTRNDHTININGGRFEAKGIKLSSNATGTNKLNLNGGTLALGSVGLDVYNNNQTMAVNVGGDATLEATASGAFPVKYPITVADGKTLKVTKGDSASDGVTLTVDKAFAGAGTIALESGIGIQFGALRDFSGFTGTLTMGGGKVSFTQAYDGEQITVPKSIADVVTEENLVLYNSSWQTITAQITENEEDGSIVIEKAIPLLTVTSTSVDFADSTLWRDGSVPTSGEILIKNTTGADVTINVKSSYGFSQVNIQSEGARVSFAFAGSATLFSGVTDGVVTINPATATLVVTDGGTYAQSIQGYGKVETVGDITFTKVSSFRGGLTVKSGTAATTTRKGFGGVDTDATAGAITVEDGACVDIGNTKDRCYTYTIAGKGIATTDANGTVTYSGAMKNTGDSIGTESMQTKAITLSGDALITAEKNWGILNSQYGGTTLTLNNHTLTKQGKGTFYICNTTGSAGTIVVKEGTFATEMKGCTLNNIVLKVQGGTTLALNSALSGLSKLFLSPDVNGVTTANNLSARLGAAVPVVVNAACYDASKLTGSEETVTLVKGNENSITNGFVNSFTVALGGRFASYTLAEDGTGITATLQKPTKFYHYDFNSATASADGAVASDSVYKINSWSSSPDVVAKGRTGSSAKIVNGKTPYWGGGASTAPTSPLDSCGAITVTVVARLPFAARASKSPLLCLGTGSNSGGSSIILVAEDPTTVAAYAFDDTGWNQGKAGRKLASVTDIKNLTTEFHFFALVVTGSETRLTVDSLPTVVVEGACAPVNSMARDGQIGAIYGNSNVYVQNLGSDGFYLDDLQVYDAILTADEIKALRRDYCPSPFVLVVQ